MLTDVVLYSTMLLRKPLNKKNQNILGTCHMPNTSLAALQTASRLTFHTAHRVDLVLILKIGSLEKLRDLPKIPQLVGGRVTV